MNTLSTSFALVLILAFVAVAGFFWWQCGALAAMAREAQQDAAAEASKLRAMIGRLVALEGAHESLGAQHRKLSGRFYAYIAEDHQAEPEPQGATYATDPLATHNLIANSRTCENYAVAQREGPLSPAASCECDYCVGRRRERDELRQKLPRGTHADRVRAIEAASRGQ